MISSKKTWRIVLAVLITFGLFSVLPEQVEAAKTKTMYVLSVKTFNAEDYSGDSLPVTKYAYYSNGLLKTEDNGNKRKYTYNNQNNVKTIQDTGVANQTHTFKYKNGKVSSSKVNASWSDYQYSYSYNKSGQLIKKICKTSGGSTTTKYTYDSKGRLSSCSSITDGRSTDKTFNIKYDSNGNIKSRSGSSNYTSVTKYTRTYKNGRLIKSVPQIKINNGSRIKSYPTTYKYKKIQVPVALVEKVKAQQHELLNTGVGIAVATACA